MQSAICIVDISSYDNLTIRYMAHYFSFLFFLSCVPKNAQQMYFPNCAIMVFAKMVHLIIWLELFFKIVYFELFQSQPTRPTWFHVGISTHIDSGQTNWQWNLSIKKTRHCQSQRRKSITGKKINCGIRIGLMQQKGSTYYTKEDKRDEGTNRKEQDHQQTHSFKGAVLIWGRIQVVSRKRNSGTWLDFVQRIRWNKKRAY